MVLLAIFFASGVCIALLLFTKVREMRTRRTPVLLRVISHGDAHMKELSHRTAHFYADSKGELHFFLKKQLPLHTKNAWYKFLTLMEERGKVLASDLRNSKIFRKSSGISEYFQSIAESAEDAERASSDGEDSQEKENTIE